MDRSTGWTSRLWLNMFGMLLDEELDYGDIWRLNFDYNLTDTLDQAKRKRGWKKFCHSSTHGSFQCGSCRKKWHSAKVVVLFHYRLMSGRGTVIMRPFGQSCRQCQDTFDLPGFSEDVVKEVLRKLFGKIRKNCYGDDDGDGDWEPSDNTRRRGTKPHEASLCEACRDGICSQNEEGNCGLNWYY